MYLGSIGKHSAPMPQAMPIALEKTRFALRLKGMSASKASLEEAALATSWTYSWDPKALISSRFMNH